MRQYLIYHTIALLLGVILDWIVGDPYWMPHPVRLIGRLIGVCDKCLLGTYDEGSVERSSETNIKREKRRGILLCIIVIGSTLLVTGIVVITSYYVNLILGICVEAALTCYVLAAKSLWAESSKVKKSLDNGNLEEARYNVSMIVGRDTECLDEIGVAKAAIETVAENTSDGVIAPLIYTAIGGPILGMTYKAINTMDSMVGYHNDRYEHFGCAAARLDDVVNYIPSRLSAFMMVAGCFFVGLKTGKAGAFSASNGYRIWRRDRLNHKSPNSAQTESACAGCLGIKLAGDASYFGKIVAKPTIGDDTRAIEYKDITRANVLMFATELISLVLVGICMAAIWELC